MNTAQSAVPLRHLHGEPQGTIAHKRPSGLMLPTEAEAVYREVFRKKTSMRHAILMREKNGMAAAGVFKKINGRWMIHEGNLLAWIEAQS